uniref:Uncharacterized protein n=1 Tax=Elaeophora elaphi TaxID=1147741 RepID=A0A0R3S3M1_9BILA
MHYESTTYEELKHQMGINMLATQRIHFVHACKRKTVTPAQSSRARICRLMTAQIITNKSTETSLAMFP